ncbi:MAG TPA: hypothetical protein VFA61_08495 [Candidatus Udaeobacter sp.]|nr:hypothetical protein [Candidatus Udaeobacter sp.]
MIRSLKYHFEEREAGNFFEPLDISMSLHIDENVPAATGDLNCRS